jgi:RimJ/RimL family protein N-acetyltransferase
MSEGQWTVEEDVDDDAVYTALAQDRIWSGYAIADLVPPFRQYSQFSIARQVEAPPTAACLVFRHPTYTSTITHGDPEGIAAILGGIELPRQTQLLVRPEHWPALANHYVLPVDHTDMLRMAVDGASFRNPNAEPSQVERLAPADLPALFELYSAHAGSVFNADHLLNGIFYGAHSGDRLIAAAGTHVVTPRHAIAAVGDIFTSAAARGHGYATAVTAAVTRDLFDAGCDDVFLNVAASNQAAISVYKRLGYHEHCHFWEAHAVLK